MITVAYPRLENGLHCSETNRLAAEFAATLITHVPDGAALGACQTMTILNDGWPIAVAVFNNWVEAYETIDLTFASKSPHWCTRKVIREVFAYPFIQLGVRRVTTITPRKNKRARSLILRLGFRFEGCVREGFGRWGDAMVYGMTKADCRWLADQSAPRARALEVAHG